MRKFVLFINFLFIFLSVFLLFSMETHAQELTDFDTNVFEDFFSHEISTFSTEIQSFNVKPIGGSFRLDVNDSGELWETTNNIVSGSFRYDNSNSADVWTTPTDFFQYYQGSEVYKSAFSYQYGNIGGVCPNSNFFNFYLSYMIDGGESFYGLDTYAEYIIPATGISGLCQINYWGANKVEMQVVCNNVPTNFTNININVYYNSPLYSGEQYKRVGQMTVNSKYSCVESSGTNDDIIINQNNNTSNIINNQNQNTDKIIDTITDSNVGGASNSAQEFFQGFQSDTFGLTSVITAPLTFINNITSSTCSPIVAPLPFVDTNLVLPCMSSIYTDYFGSFFTLYQSITFGVVAYWVIVRIFNLVKDFKNPEHDEIEVFDL